MMPLVKCEGEPQAVVRLRLSKKANHNAKPGHLWLGRGLPRPRKVTLQRCFLFGNAPRGVEDAAPYKRKMRFFDTLSHADAWLFLFP